MRMKLFNKSVLPIIVSGVTTLAMTGCGGGGSSDLAVIAPAPSSTPTPTLTPTPPVEISNIYTDNDTRVMWQDDVYSAMVTKPWLDEANYAACRNDEASGACEDTSGDTAATYCTDMTLGEYTDWRLPTKDELSYLGTSDKYHNLTNIVFGGWYWTATNDPTGLNRSAYVVEFTKSNSTYRISGKGTIRYIRCIRNMGISKNLPQIQ